MTPLNNVENVNINDFPGIEIYPDSASSSVCNSHRDKQFTGFREIIKKRKFFSNNLKFFPWRSDAPLEEWTSDNGLSLLTEQFRNRFDVFLQASLNFDFYQLRPVEIPFTDTLGKKQKYQPLALLTYRDDDGFPFKLPNLLIDIWCDKDIKRHQSILHPAFRAANRFALSRKLNFRVYRDDFFYSDYFINLSFVRRFLTQRIKEENQRLIMNIFREKRILNLSELIELFDAKDNNHLGGLIRDTWILVSRGMIQTDWQIKFHKDTVLWLW